MQVIDINRADFAAQLPEIGWFYETSEAQAESLEMWDRLVEGEDCVTLYIRGYAEGFGCYMASMKPEGFYNYYLPICKRLADPAS